MAEHKSEQMMQTALANGWKSEVIPDMTRFEKSRDPEDIVWNVYGIRGEEKIHIEFTGDRQTACTYRYGAYVERPARRAGAIRLLTGKADPKKYKATSTADAIEKLVEARSVPWDRDAPFLDILLAVLGREIRWIRKMDGEVLSAYVPAESNKKSKYFRLIESPPHSGRRVLEWTNSEGFHAVALDNIIDVA